jgi:hypothetical protein
MMEAQLTQRIRGSVVDQGLQKPVAGATVTLPGLYRSGVTDSAGHFAFSHVPVGRQQLHISNVGYKEVLQDDILVEAGKETVLNIALEPIAHLEKEVVVSADSRNHRPLNEMSIVSVRSFSVEETRKYAASFDDPLRMATGFAGVAAPNDGNNDIVIRGNSPTGLLWRMEGVDIPNPNHFASPVSTGGGISILSAQLLSNSDFLTGAFPAEYGDALSGVFDLKLRKGNDEKKEYSLQAGLLGLSASAEGPLRAGSKGSYLANYRYSTLALLDKMGLAVPQGSDIFQDLSYNLVLPTARYGTFSLFGFGGLSSQIIKPKLDSTKWKSQHDRYAENFSSNTGMTGLTHSISLGQKTNLRSVLALSYVEKKITDNYLDNNYSLSRAYKGVDKTPKWTLTSTLNHRFGAGNLLRAGYILNSIGYTFYQQDQKTPGAPLLEQVNTTGHTQTIQGFAEWESKVADRLTCNVGFHYLELLYNHTYSLEPRASLKWEPGAKGTVALGYGLHSQIQALGVYFAQDTNATAGFIHPNGNLGLTRAHHFVLSYNYRLATHLNLKTEVYYQYLFNVPVNANDTNTFSTLNITESDYVTDPLINKGKGRNYGIEITLEKQLSNNLYYMVNGSFYQSKYTARDGIERNTRFAGNQLINFVAGKDFKTSFHGGRSKTFGINIKAIYSGGYRTTPIDMQQSVLQGTTVVEQQQAYSLQDPAYFRADLGLVLKKEHRGFTSSLSLDIQNVSNRKNIYDYTYDPLKNKQIADYQAGMIPVLNYKVEF